MKIIDTHIHLFEKPYSDLFNNSHIKNGAKGELHLYEEYRKKYNIEAAFVICYDEGHCPENSSYVRTLAKERKWVYSFGYAKPENFHDNANRIILRGHFGISCYLKKEDSGKWLNDSIFNDLWKELQNKNIPLNLTTWPHQCLELGKLLKRFSHLTILINHMGRPHLENGKLEIESYKNVLALSDFENVFVKLSGFYAFSEKGWSFPQCDLFPTLKLLRKKFGSERLMFASDFSPILEFNTYCQAVKMLWEKDTGFTENELEKIYYHNAKKIILERKEYDC